MSLKNQIIKEFLRLMDSTDLNDASEKEIRLLMRCGSEVVIRFNLITKKIRLKLVRSS